MLVIQNQPDRPLAHFGGELVRRLAHDGSSFSEVEPSGKPSAVQIVYVEENGVQARLALDGNDFHATHFVMYKGDEPIGSLRVRWFAGFAKIERSAIRKAYRNPRVMIAATKFVLNHIALKGYRKVLTSAAPIYARLWRMTFGFKEVQGKPRASYGGHEPYVELEKDLDIPNDAITIDADPMVMFRIEGEWDQPGKFEL